MSRGDGGGTDVAACNLGREIGAAGGNIGGLVLNRGPRSHTHAHIRTHTRTRTHPHMRARAPQVPAGNARAVHSHAFDGACIGSEKHKIK